MLARTYIRTFHLLCCIIEANLVFCDHVVKLFKGLSVHSPPGPLALSSKLEVTSLNGTQNWSNVSE